MILTVHVGSGLQNFVVNSELSTARVRVYQDYLGTGMSLGLNSMAHNRDGHGIFSKKFVRRRNGYGLSRFHAISTDSVPVSVLRGM